MATANFGWSAVRGAPQVSHSNFFKRLINRRAARVSERSVRFNAYTN
jgi:hypothetical protein